MSFLFGGGDSTPAPAPVPQTPNDSEELQRQRQAAADAAAAESAARGRRSTIVAGMSIAADEQNPKGLLSAKRRAAAKELGQ